MATPGQNTGADRHRLTADQMPPPPTSGAVTAGHGTRAAAVAETGRGHHVFPLVPGTKVPLLERWQERTSADPEYVARAWPGPWHNIGVACGPSRRVVLDLDTHGELPAEWAAEPGIRDGRDVFAALCEWAGQDWPVTYWTVTPSGGWHLYFTAPEVPRIRNSSGRLAPMIDVRAVGGYVVGAGSAAAGGRYEVLDGRDPAPLPEWLAAALTSHPPPAAPPAALGSGEPGRRLAALADVVRRARPGERTGALVWAAFRVREMATAGDADPDAGEVLVAAAVAAGIRGGEHYARRQVRSLLTGSDR